MTDFDEMLERMRSSEKDRKIRRPETYRGIALIVVTGALMCFFLQAILGVLSVGK